MASIIEQVYDRVKEYVVDNIKDYLQNEEQQSDDQLTLPEFKVVYRGDVDIMSIKQYPSLMMRYGQIELTNETTTSDLMLVPITFWVLINGANYDHLQRKLERYAWCLKQLFDADRTLGGVAVESMVKAISFSPVFTATQASQMCFLDTEIKVLVERI